jgi:lauroyl/myristoyl acyltransferase
MSSTLTPAATPLARQARERFVAHMEAVLPELSEAVRTALADAMNAAQSSRDMHARRDALVEFEK